MLTSSQVSATERLKRQINIKLSNLWHGNIPGSTEFTKIDYDQHADNAWRSKKLHFLYFCDQTSIPGAAKVTNVNMKTRTPVTITETEIVR